MTKIVGISTCKGRLGHVQQTSRAFLESMPSDVSKYLLVDYSCPEHSGDWVKQSLGYTGRVDSVTIKARCNAFHKTVAINAGSKHAINIMDAEYLLYFDADTIIYPGLFNQIKPLLCENKFIIADPTGEEDLTGLLIIHKNMFLSSGGFEESFRGWGSEDLEFRLRLFAKHKYEFEIISCEYLSPIHHDDSIRVKYYDDKDIVFSNKRNLFRLKQMYKAYMGKDLRLTKLMESNNPDKEALFKLLSLHPRTKK
jgi:hypothetical protein